MYNSHDLAISIKAVAKEKNKVIKEMLKTCELSSNTMSSLYHGKSIAFDSVAKIADYLEVSVDYLLGRTDEPHTVKEHSNSANISNSNIVDHSHGTITINNGETSKEPQTESISKQTVINETTKELIGVFESLPTRERIRLLNMVYDFEEQYRKSNQPLPQVKESSAFNTKSKWRIAARTIDGTYESRHATPEEIEKLKLLEDAPEPDF